MTDIDVAELAADYPAALADAEMEATFRITLLSGDVIELFVQSHVTIHDLIVRIRDSLALPHVTQFGLALPDSEVALRLDENIFPSATPTLFKQVTLPYTVSSAIDHVDRFVGLFADHRPSALPLSSMYKPVEEPAVISTADASSIPESKEFPSISPSFAPVDPRAVALGVLASKTAASTAERVANASAIDASDAVVESTSSQTPSTIVAYLSAMKKANAAATSTADPAAAALAVAANVRASVVPSVAAAAEVEAARFAVAIPPAVTDVSFDDASCSPAARLCGQWFTVTVTTLDGAKVVVTATADGFRVGKNAYPTLFGAVAAASKTAARAMDISLRHRRRVPVEASAAPATPTPAGWLHVAAGAPPVVSWLATRERARRFVGRSEATCGENATTDLSNLPDTIARLGWPQLWQPCAQFTAIARDACDRIGRGEVLSRPIGTEYCYMHDGVFVYLPQSVDPLGLDADVTYENARLEVTATNSLFTVDYEGPIRISPSAVGDFGGTRILAQLPIPGLVFAPDLDKQHAYGLREVAHAVLDAEAAEAAAAAGEAPVAAPGPLVDSGSSLVIDVPEQHAEKFAELGAAVFAKKHTVRALSTRAMEGYAPRSEAAPWSLADGYTHAPHAKGAFVGPAIDLVLSPEVRGSVAETGQVHAIDLASVGVRDTNFLHLPWARVYPHTLQRYVQWHEQGGVQRASTFNPDLFSASHALLCVDAKDGGASSLAEDEKDLRDVAEWAVTQHVPLAVLHWLHAHSPVGIATRDGRKLGDGKVSTVLKQFALPTRYLGYVAAEAAAVSAYPRMWAAAVRYVYSEAQGAMDAFAAESAAAQAMHEQATKDKDSAAAGKAEDSDDFEKIDADEPKGKPAPKPKGKGKKGKKAATETAVVAKAADREVATDAAAADAAAAAAVARAAAASADLERRVGKVFGASSLCVSKLVDKFGAAVSAAMEQRDQLHEGLAGAASSSARVLQQRAEAEMVARCTRRYIRMALHAAPRSATTSVIAAVLSAVLGNNGPSVTEKLATSSVIAAMTGVTVGVAPTSDAAVAAGAPSLFGTSTPPKAGAIVAYVRHMLQQRYVYTPAVEGLPIPPPGPLRLGLLRMICEMTGIIISAVPAGAKDVREFDFTQQRPVQAADVYDMQPVVKGTQPPMVQLRSLYAQLLGGVTDLGTSRGDGLKALCVLPQLAAPLASVYGPVSDDAAWIAHSVAEVTYHGLLRPGVAEAMTASIVARRVAGADSYSAGVSLLLLGLLLRRMHLSEGVASYANAAAVAIGQACGVLALHAVSEEDLSEIRGFAALAAKAGRTAWADAQGLDESVVVVGMQEALSAYRAASSVTQLARGMPAGGVGPTAMCRMLSAAVAELRTPDAEALEHARAAAAGAIKETPEDESAILPAERRIAPKRKAKAKGKAKKN